MCVWVKVAQSCPILCDLMDCTVHGILQARILEWVAFPFSRGSSQLRNRTQVSRIAGIFFTNWATREAQHREVLEKYWVELLKANNIIEIHMMYVLKCIWYGLPWWLSGIEAICQCRVWSLGWEDLLPGEGNGYPLQYSGLENSMDCTVHEITKSQTGLSNIHFSSFDSWSVYQSADMQMVKFIEFYT